MSPLADKIISDNSDVVKAVAKGEASCENGGGFYPIICEPGEPTHETCSRVGLIECDDESNNCPAFLDPYANARDDKISGGVCFFLGIVILFICLAGLVTVLQKMLMGVSTRIIYKSTDMNGYLAIAIGAGITILVQSSSITTSTLTPFVGIGAIRLEQMFPLTLGANIGTTVTGSAPSRSFSSFLQHQRYCDLLSYSLYATHSSQHCSQTWPRHTHLAWLSFDLHCRHVLPRPPSFLGSLYVV